MSLLRPDLSPLLAELADGTISAAEFARLEAALREDRAARDEFRAWMAMEAALPWMLGGEDAAAGGGAATAAAHATGGLRRRRESSGRRLAGVWLVPVLVVAGGLAAVAAWRGGSRPEVGRAAIADLSGDAAWHDSVVRKLGDTIPSGVVRLERGAAQVRFARGAVVSLNAPVEFEVLGDNRLFLRSGRITSSVPPEAHGFTVVSPDGEVVDFGTEFTVGVDRDGKTDVYVVAGEVDVAAGHSVLEERVRLTQGFATRLGRDGPASPRISQQPIILDSFDRASGANPAGAALELRWRSVDGDGPAEIVGGEFRIPIDGRPGRRYPIARVAIEHDFSVLVGRRSHVSFKATLPNVGTAPVERWAGIVVDDRRQEAEMAYKAAACFGVLVSPSWQAQVLVKGQLVTRQRVFARDSEAIGPYQVVMVLDDSAAGRERFGSATLTVMINGMEVARDHPVELCGMPRIQFQTNTLDDVGGLGFAVIDDVCVSVEAAADPGGA
jgi:hypothetical protein